VVHWLGASFATAAKVVMVSRFYGVFAAHLQDDPGRLYALDPAQSPLVTSIASVAQTMLLFWFGIAVSDCACDSIRCDRIT